MITLLTLAVNSGFSPYIPLLVFGAASRTEYGLAIRPSFSFVQEWGFLGVLLALVGIDVVMNKLPATATYVNRIGWLVKPAAAALMVVSAATVSDQFVAPLAALAGGLAISVHWIRNWLIGKLGGRFMGFEEFVVGAYSEIGSTFVALFAFLIPVVGALLAALMLMAATIFGRKNEHSET